MVDEVPIELRQNYFFAGNFIVHFPSEFELCMIYIFFIVDFPLELRQYMLEYGFLYFTNDKQIIIKKELDIL